MKSLIFFFVSSFVPVSLLAQWAIPAQMRAGNTLDRLSTTNSLSASDILYGVPLPPGALVGDYYLDNKWNKSTVLLYKSENMIEGYYARYDINSDLVEFKTKSGVKVLEIQKIKNLVWIDSLTAHPHYFVNSKEYKFDGTELTGFLEVIVDGTLPLMKRTELTVKEPTYVVAFDVGSRDTKIYKKHSFLYAMEQNLFEIKGKKDLQKASGHRINEVETFIKKQKLNPNKEPDLKQVFEFLNKQ
jgi:hypothetical protein